MIDQGLADNFEDSLSGLGVDITTVSFMTINSSDMVIIYSILYEDHFNNGTFSIP